MNQYTGIYRRCELLFIQNELERFRLQPLEGKALNFLRRGSYTQEDVYTHFDAGRGRVTRNLSELEEEGLVCRVVNERNKRQRLVSLTAEDEEVLAEADKISMR